MAMWLHSLIVIWMYSINLANFSIIQGQDPSELSYNSDGLGCYSCKENFPDHQKGIQESTHTSVVGENNDIIDGEHYFSPEENIYKVSYVAQYNGYISRAQRSAGDEGGERSSRPEPVTKPPATKTTTGLFDDLLDDIFATTDGSLDEIIDDIFSTPPPINKAALESISGNRG